MSIIVLNPNNLAVKLNFSNLLYIHIDRSTYTKQESNSETLQNELKVYHKCVLHINTNIDKTDFNNIICSLTKNNIQLTQNFNYSDFSIVLQDDTNDRINVEPILNTCYVIFQKEAYEKKVVFKPNKTITCSKRLKLHSGLKPFNYEQLITNQQGGNNNE